MADEGLAEHDLHVRCERGKKGFPMSSGSGTGRCRLTSRVDTAVFDWPLVIRLEFGPLPGAAPCVRLQAQIAGGKPCRG